LAPRTAEASGHVADRVPFAEELADLALRRVEGRNRIADVKHFAGVLLIGRLTALVRL
jgi:hypothetical protein